MRSTSFRSISPFFYLNLACSTINLTSTIINFGMYEKKLNDSSISKSAQSLEFSSMVSLFAFLPSFAATCTLAFTQFSDNPKVKGISIALTSLSCLSSIATLSSNVATHAL